MDPESTGNTFDNDSLARQASADDRNIELTVLMPCLNESETLAVCIRKAQQAMRENEISGEVLIADNGSTDGSQKIATDLGARVVDVKEKGYGSALMGGIAAARGRFVIMGDADDSYNFLDLPVFLEQLRAGHDLVMGNRFAGGIRPGAMPFLHRYLGNPVLTAIGRFFFHCPSKDFHCGLRGFDRSAINDLNLRATGMEFASEMVVKATLHRLRITEVPTTLSPDGRTRSPHLRTWRDGWRHLRFLLLFSPRWLFLYPGLVLMALGAVTGLWLWPGERHVGGVVLDVHTMIYSAAAILIGFQAVLFAFFSKIYAINEGLRPNDPRFMRLFRVFTLELGLVVGGLLVLAGLGGSMWAVITWSRQSFGPLESSHTLRIVIPSVLALTLGFQTVLSSFFFSVLGLRTTNTRHTS